MHNECRLSLPLMRGKAEGGGRSKMAATRCHPEIAEQCPKEHGQRPPPRRQVTLFPRDLQSPQLRPSGRREAPLSAGVREGLLRTAQPRPLWLRWSPGAGRGGAQCDTPTRSRAEPFRADLTGGPNGSGCTKSQRPDLLWNLHEVSRTKHAPLSKAPIPSAGGKMPPVGCAH